MRDDTTKVVPPIDNTAVSEYVEVAGEQVSSTSDMRELILELQVKKPWTGRKMVAQMYDAPDNGQLMDTVPIPSQDSGKITVKLPGLDMWQANGMVVLRFQEN